MSSAPAATCDAAASSLLFRASSTADADMTRFLALLASDVDAYAERSAALQPAMRASGRARDEE